VVYLLHLERPLSHAKHLLLTSVDADVQDPSAVDLLNADASGLLWAALQAGIGFAVTRTWPGGSRILKRLQAQANTPRYCPTCRHASGAVYD